MFAYKYICIYKCIHTHIYIKLYIYIYSCTGEGKMFEHTVRTTSDGNMKHLYRFSEWFRYGDEFHMAWFRHGTGMERCMERNGLQLATISCLFVFLTAWLERIMVWYGMVNQDDWAHGSGARPSAKPNWKGIRGPTGHAASDMAQVFHWPPVRFLGGMLKLNKLDPNLKTHGVTKLRNPTDTIQKQNQCVSNTCNYSGMDHGYGS